MRQILGIIILSLFCVNFSLAELVQSKVREKYKIDDKILAITNNGFLDEVYLCNSSNENCKLINKHFSFIKLAQECESIQKKISILQLIKNIFLWVV